jgi:DNA repair protein RadC
VVILNHRRGRGKYWNDLKKKLLQEGCSPSRGVRAGVTDRASAIIVAHNHPAGGLEPSASDVEVTTQLKAAGVVMGIALLDHIIFNRIGYFSFLEAGRL